LALAADPNRSRRSGLEAGVITTLIRPGDGKKHKNRSCLTEPRRCKFEGPLLNCRIRA